MSKMGRPKKEQPNLIKITYKINSNLNEKLEEYSQKSGKTKSRISREALETFLEQNGK